MRAIPIVFLILLLSCQRETKQRSEPVSVAAESDSINSTLVADRNLVWDYDPFAKDSLVLAIIEIPAGTNAKWEVTKDGRAIEWEREDNAYRIVKYLAYPFNYGMVPQTTLPISSGGDGDPLDIAVLGPTRPRGTVVGVRIIGILRLLDRDETDDKLVAVDISGPMGGIRSLDELDSSFAGVTDIVATWFTNYKGPGVTKSNGFENAEEAWKMLKAANRAFLNSSSRE